MCTDVAENTKICTIWTRLDIGTELAAIAVSCFVVEFMDYLWRITGVSTEFN